MRMKKNELEDIELPLLLDAVFQRYGYDFRNYAKATMLRRVRQFVDKTGYKHISDLIPKILRDPSFFQALVADFSITVTEMFRDPPFYKAIREQVVSLLKTYPFIKIWHAGCATGEEVYAMAILLKEEGLYERSTIFATDINDNALTKAKEGVFSLEHIREYTENYQESAGCHSFSEYYHADQKNMIVNSSLKKNITFANHNLVSDQVFGEMHLILCRNVIIYFNKDLQNRVLQLFHDSLIRGGFLCLGSKETLRFSLIHDQYRTIDGKNKIYQKRVRLKDRQGKQAT